MISLGLHKHVHIRLTTDNWLTYTDHPAIYSAHSHDGICDRFSFAIDIDRERIIVGNTIEFCLCYASFNGVEYWDNNHEQNYRFTCQSRNIPDYSLVCP